MDQSPAAAAQRLAFNERKLISAVSAGDTETVADLLDRGVPIGIKDDKGLSLLHCAARGGHVTTMRLLIRRGCDVDSVDGRGLTPLHCAAAMGRKKAVRELIRKVESTSVVAGNCGTPLHQAALNGHVKTTVAMLEEGCSLYVGNSDGATVLHFAAAGGNVELVRLLVVRGCDVNAMTANGCTPLHDAAGSGRTEAVHELIKLGAAKSVDAGTCGTPLHQAAINGHVETAVAMLEEGCPLDVVSGAGATVLHSAAAGGNVDLVREMVGRGCDVNAVKADGCTPLHFAAGGGRTEAVHELIKLGAAKSVDAGTCGTPLHQAAINGHVETAVAMLEEGCPLDVVSGAGATVLHSAAAGGNVDLVKELVVRGSDVKEVEADGRTPLHDAAAFGRTEAVCELIKLGAEMSVAGVYGTPLDEAAFYGHVNTVVAMLEKGCSVNFADSAGVTVMHWAAQGGHVEVLKELARRCKVNAVAANGCTPLHDAAAGGRTEAVRELVKLGAEMSVVAGEFGTPLHQAALNGHEETAVAMLEEGCPLDVVSSAGATVLHFAATGGNVDLVWELVVRGCDVNAVKANGCTPLHDAAYHGRTEAAHELIKLGAAKSVVPDKCGTPLYQAAINGHVKTAVAIMEEGCPLDVVNSDGETVLHWAAAGGNVELVWELLNRGCDVNAVKANGCTPLHDAAGSGRTEAVCELIKLGAAKSVVSRMHGMPLHQAVGSGCVETVEALLKDDHEPDSTSAEATPSQPQLLERSSIGARNSVGQTPVMWAVQYGLVEVFELLISKGGAISDRDTHSLSVFEHCFVGGQASNLGQFGEAIGIRSSGEGLKGALTTMITRGLVDAQKVICLCAYSGDSVFLDETFIDLVASDACAMPAAVKYTKFYFGQGEGDSFLNHLSIPDENTLNPLQISLLSLKCYEMGFASDSVQRGANDHTLFITKLLSHPVLKETVHENFPNGLSSLDLAQRFELHPIAELIKRAGGRPGVWAGVPQEIEVRYPLALTVFEEALAYINALAEDGGTSVQFIADRFSTALQPSLWQRQAATVGANVGAETDTRKFQSLPLMASDDEVCELIVECNMDINAMLNHREGGRIHFGIDSSGRVEVGLYLEQNKVITKLTKTVGLMLRRYCHPVESSYVQVEPVNLRKYNQELTDRWRFDILVTPHPTVVQLAPKDTGYYRHGATSVRMTYGEFVWKIRAERGPQRSLMKAIGVDGSVSDWDAKKSATVGANVGAESADHEYKSLMGPVGDEGQPPRNVYDVVRRVGGKECRRAINAMLNYPTGGCIHYGINDNGIVQEGLDLDQRQALDELRKMVGEVLRDFWLQVEPFFVKVDQVTLQNDKKEETGRWRFDIVVNPHPTVVLLSEDKPAYYRWGTQCQKMVHRELAEKVRCEPAGQFPHGY